MSSTAPTIVTTPQSSRPTNTNKPLCFGRNVTDEARSRRQDSSQLLIDCLSLSIWIEIQAKIGRLKLRLCSTWFNQPTSWTYANEREIAVAKARQNENLATLALVYWWWQQRSESSETCVRYECVSQCEVVNASRMFKCIRVPCCHKVVFNCVYVSLSSVRLLTPRWTV